MRAALLDHKDYFSNNPGYVIDHIVGVAGGNNDQAALFKLFLSWNLLVNNTPYHDRRAGKILSLVLPRRLRIAVLSLLTVAELDEISYNKGTYIGKPPSIIYLTQEKVLNEQPNPIVLNLLSTPSTNYDALMSYLNFTAPPLDECIYMLKDLFNQANYTNANFTEITLSNNTLAAAQWLCEYFGYPTAAITYIQETIFKYEIKGIS
jgi:hypothetical protein